MGGQPGFRTLVPLSSIAVLPARCTASARECRRRSRPRRGLGARSALPAKGVAEIGNAPRSKKKKRQKHNLSEVRADFLDLRWAPLAAPPPPPLARQGGGPAPIREICADLQEFVIMPLISFSTFAVSLPWATFSGAQEGLLG